MIKLQSIFDTTDLHLDHCLVNNQMVELLKCKEFFPVIDWESAGIIMIYLKHSFVQMLSSVFGVES
jgi:hypothetical protein